MVNRPSNTDPRTVKLTDSGAEAQRESVNEGTVIVLPSIELVPFDSVMVRPLSGIAPAVSVSTTVSLVCSTDAGCPVMVRGHRTVDALMLNTSAVDASSDAVTPRNAEASVVEPAGSANPL